MLREHGVLSTAHATDLALDICDALSTVHANGVVHGQLGLRCVRLTLTREAGPQDLDIFTLTAEGDGEVAAQATPFLAPEQRDLSRIIDGRADIWALGALLYTTLVGKAPPAGPLEIPAESVPASLASIVASCLAVDPARRPQDVDELTEKLGSFATWPPDRFARLAERRELRASAERARLALEARGLQNMPDVLDKLDEAAVARAQREATPRTAKMSSILERPTTTAALERLMAVVHEGTEAARVELAADLPALVDFDDEDEMVLPTSVAAEPLVLEPVASPLETVPMFLAQPAPALLPPPAAPRRDGPAPAAPPRRGVGAIVGLALAAFVLSLAVGYVGFRMSAAHTAPAPPVAAAPPPPIAPPATATASATAAAAEIPLFVPSALPEVAPVTPGSLPDAKR